jgi:hypothetical protein
LAPWLEESKPDAWKMEWERVDIELVGGCVERGRIRKGMPSVWGRNYYLGHCPQGILGVRGYGEVVVEGVWPGVDWVLRYDEGVGGVKQEFVVQGGYRWDGVRLRIWSRGGAEVSEGRLRVRTAYGEIVEEGLVGYYGSERVGVRYRVLSERREGDVKVVEVGYEVSGVPEVGEKTLVIDPVLQWGTYFGGSGSEEAYSVAVDGSGNVFVVGTTISAYGFPLANPGGGAYFDNTLNGYYWDGFIAKFSGSNLSLLWSTYFGGNDYDEATSVAVDGSGNVFVVGWTEPPAGFPLENPGGGAYYDNTYNGGDRDAFIAKFSGSNLRLVWSTYYGGSDRDCTLGNRGIVVGAGFIAVGVTTHTTDGSFPVGNYPSPCSGGFYQGTHGGVTDLAILTFDLNGVPLWRTFYGGFNFEGGVEGVAVYSTYLYVVLHASGPLRASHLPNPGGGAYYDDTPNGGGDVVLLRFDYANCPLLRWEEGADEGAGDGRGRWEAWWDGGAVRVAGVGAAGWYSVVGMDGRVVGRWYVDGEGGALEGPWSRGLYVVYQEGSGESRRVYVGP